MDQLFHISLFTAADALEATRSPSKPHQHDYEELIIGMEGQLEHFIDFNTVLVNAPFASFVAKGKTHRVLPNISDGKCSMWVLRFKSEFIPETTFQLYANYHDQANISMQPGPCFDRMVGLCEMIAGEMQQAIPDLAIAQHLLSALFTMIESGRRRNQSDESDRQSVRNSTFRNFLAILEENFRRPEGVEFYAEKLFMSARNLNLICQQVLQKSVSEIIETRKLIEAKNLLSSTDLSISEIGFELGYKEKAYFSNVFKKRTGQTPTEFREEMRRLIS
ncbi:MAG: helix-turn-helix transcriptional regulator [Lewinellaceae bacterium]|nr:helix-turn-helix transcriptional regulator [Saprospiraceae bacterium]MCB9334405.1 helix-turn-helix transcriptional regulator [Lewinellaceae bacterium]